MLIPDPYLKSVERGGNLLLNVPPDRKGLFYTNDPVALVGFKKLREENFRNNFSLSARGELHYKGIVYQNNKLIDGTTKSVESFPDYHQGFFWIKFKQEVKVNCIVLKEPIEKGQQIKKIKISLINGSEQVAEFQLTTIGRKRILSFPVQYISGIRIEFEDAKGKPYLSEVETYLIDESLIKK